MKGNLIDEMNNTCKALLPWVIAAVVLVILYSMFPKQYESYESTMRHASQEVDNQVERNHELEQEAYDYNQAHRGDEV